MGAMCKYFANMLDNNKNECILRVLVGIHSKLLLVITNPVL
jgi:hypothetical protein